MDEFKLNCSHTEVVCKDNGLYYLYNTFVSLTSTRSTDLKVEGIRKIFHYTKDPNNDYGLSEPDPLHADLPQHTAHMLPLLLNCPATVA